MVVIAIVAFLLSKYNPYAKVQKADIVDSNSTRHVSRDPNTQRTALYSRTKSRVEKREEYLIKEKIEPWLFLSTGKMKITRHDGSTFAPGDLAYGGSVVRVFWEALIEPFLEEDIQAVLDEVGTECRINGIDAKWPLKEAGMLLEGMVWRIYNRMAYVDQKLRTKRGGGKLPPPRDVKHKIEPLTVFVNEQLEAAIGLYSKQG